MLRPHHLQYLTVRRIMLLVGLAATTHGASNAPLGRGRMGRPAPSNRDWRLSQQALATPGAGMLLDELAERLGMRLTLPPGSSRSVPAAPPGCARCNERVPVSLDHVLGLG